MAIVMLFTYVLADQVDIKEEEINIYAGAVLVLPFVLFSSLAGQIADKYSKSTLIRYVKFIEILVMIIGAIGFYFSSFWALLGLLFLMATQSAFFGPLKYALLPELLEEKELITGNAYVEGATFFAIVLGLLIASVLILAPNGIWLTAGVTIGSALVGWLMSLKIPDTKSTVPDLDIDYNIFRSTFTIVRSANSNKPVITSILAIGWFWFIGFLFTAQFPAFTKNTLGAGPEVVLVFLAVFAIGTAIGSYICAHLLKGEISARYSPAAGVLIAIFTIDLYFASLAIAGSGTGELVGLESFIQLSGSWRLIFDLGMIAAAGGVYIVPFYTFIQERSADKERSRMVAVNNIVSSSFMVLASIYSLTMISQGLTIPDILLGSGIGSLIVAALIWRSLPIFSK